MKKQILFILLILVSLSSIAMPGSDFKNYNDSLKNYLQAALDLMKKKSVNSHKMNWNQIYKEAYLAAADSKKIRDLYPVILKSLEKLEDSHSKFFPPETVKSYVMGYRVTGQQFPEIKATLLKDRYAYISLPQFYSYNFAEWNEFADTFREKIKPLEKQNPAGWIIDLRDNDGGMLAPMYAAIAPFVDQSHVIGWKDGAGTNHFIDYRDNNFYEDKVVTHKFKLANQKIKIRNKPIVVLINRKTASSGEFVAALFVGQKNVTFIGVPTNGLTSSNQEHQLTDGAFLVLTEGNLIDRNHKEYSKMGEGIQPDIKTENLTNDLKLIEQLYLEKANEILNAKKLLKPKG